MASKGFKAQLERAANRELDAVIVEQIGRAHV